MTIYASGQRTAARLVASYGIPVSYTSIADTVPNAAKPWDTDRANVTTSVLAIVSMVDLHEVDGQTIYAGDKVYTIAKTSLTAEPKAGDKITEGSSVYTVKQVRPEGSVPVFYECLARK